MNLQKQSILSVSILIVTLSTSISIVFGESDFNLVLTNVTEDPKISKFNVTGESYKQICPSGQCNIEYTYTNFIAPSPSSRGIAYSIDFVVEDNITNKDLGPKKKEYLEQYGANMFGCMVSDIIEDNDQEIYYCSDRTNSIARDFDSNHGILILLEFMTQRKIHIL